MLGNDMRQRYKRASYVPIWALARILCILKEKMKRIIFTLSCILSLTATIKAQSIFTEDYASQADVKVFVVDYESQADLKVYKVDYESQARGNEGRWFFVAYASQADKTIFFVDYESQADLKIFFVNYESQAGWRNSNKKHLMY